MSLKKTAFLNTELKECDFTEADLTEAVFSKCDLMRTIFERTNLTKTNFETAFHLQLDPEKNTLKKTIFSESNIEGLLSKFDIVIKK